MDAVKAVVGKSVSAVSEAAPKEQAPKAQEKPVEKVENNNAVREQALRLADGAGKKIAEA